MKRPGIIDAKLRSLITAVCFNLNRARRRFTVLVMDLDDFLTNKQEIFNEIHRGAEVYPNIKFGDLVEDYSDSSDSDLEILDPKPVGNQNTAITLEHRFSAGGSRER